MSKNWEGCGCFSFSFPSFFFFRTFHSKGIWIFIKASLATISLKREKRKTATIIEDDKVVLRFWSIETELKQLKALRGKNRWLGRGKQREVYRVGRGNRVNYMLCLLRSVKSFSYRHRIYACPLFLLFQLLTLFYFFFFPI